MTDEFSPFGPLPLRKSVWRGGSKFALSDWSTDGIRSTGYNGRHGLAVPHLARRLIAAGQKLDCFYLVAQFGSVPMIAQAMQRSASPSIIIWSVEHWSTPGSSRTANHGPVGSLPSPSACFQSVGFGSFAR
jgi:hypothetical protein